MSGVEGGWKRKWGGGGVEEKRSGGRGWKKWGRGGWNRREEVGEGAGFKL